jgi:hypothetical protein
MATIEQLIERNVLTRVDVPLDGEQRPWRTILAVDRIVKWMGGELPILDGNRGDLTPIQQLDAFFADFVSGEKLEFRRHLRVIKPTSRVSGN